MGDHPSWCTLCSFSHTPLNGIPIMLTLPLWDMVAVFSSLCIWCLWHLSNLSWSANVWLISHPCNKRLLMCSQGPHNAFRRNTASTLLVSLSTYKKVWFFFYCDVVICTAIVQWNRISIECCEHKEWKTEKRRIITVITFLLLWVFFPLSVSFTSFYHFLIWMSKCRRLIIS